MAKISIVGDFQGAVSRPLGEATLSQRLNAPSDPPKQELLVIRSGLLAESLNVLLSELADCHPAQLVNLFPHRGLHIVLHLQLFLLGQKNSALICGKGYIV
jgi:hypothetical protein